MSTVQVSGGMTAVILMQLVTTGAMLGIGRHQTLVQRALPYLVSGAAGVLLSTACLDLLPEAVHAAGSGMGMWGALLLTLLSLFAIQTIARRVAGGSMDPEQHHAHSFGWEHTDLTRELASTENVAGARHLSPGTLLLGSALHSAVDGVAIAAAFAAGKGPGWSATFAVGLHEMPHRLGDFALLLHLGFSRRRAAAAAAGAGAMAVLGAIAVIAFGQAAASTVWLLPVSAGSFLYIALVDLLPEMHTAERGARPWWQLVCLLAGAALMAAVVRAAG